MDGFWTQLIRLSREYVAPVTHIVVPIAILVVGWLIAVIVSAICRRVLRRTDIDNRIAGWVVGEEAAARVEVEKWTAKGIYYVLMLFVLVGFFQAVGLTIVTEPLKEMLVYVFTFAPRILSAGLLLIFAWILGRVLRFLVVRGLTAASIDERLGESAGLEEPGRLTISQNVGNAVYWLVFLLVLPAVLSTLALDGLLSPIRDMLDEITGFLPNLFAGGVILFIGWLTARIVQRVVASLLAATGIDGAGERAGMDTVLGKSSLSALVGAVVYAFILILAAIAALDALQFDAISIPASSMLTTVMNAVPAIFIAGVLLLVAYLAGRLVGGLVTDLLTRAGFNSVPARLGVGSEPAEGERTLSELVGYLLLVAFMLFAAIEAADLIGFAGLSDLISQLTEFVGHVALGLVIFGLGLYLANLAAGIVLARAGEGGGLLSTAVRTAILILAAAMALRQMGLANEIINIAFGLLLGAVAVAIALAFGLGARDIAAKEVERWLEAMRGKSEKK